MSALPSIGVQPLALIHRAGPLREFLVDQGLEVIGPTGLPVWEAGRGVVGGLVRLGSITPVVWATLRRLGVDLVHANDGRMTITWAGAARLAAVPFIVHQRTPLFKSRMTRLALSWADAIVAISAYTRDSLPNNLLPRTSVVSNPFEWRDIVGRSAARSALVNELGIDPSLPVMVSVGTIMRRKRPLVAVDVLSALRNKGIAATLLLAGRTEGTESGMVVDAIARAGLRDHVRLLGYRSDIDRLLAGCDLLLAPAVDEGHGRAVVEAMLAGTPVIAAKSGGHVEILRDGVTGRLVDPDDVDAMATAAAELLTHYDRASLLAHRAREDAAARFSIDAHAQSMAAIYRSVLAARRATALPL